MELQINRIGGNNKTTIGTWFIGEGLSKYFFCFSIEDARQTEKIPGKTRISAGRYEIVLNTTGGMNEAYSKYDWHKGMLELASVSNFTHIYIHPGNDEGDTEGCLLPNYKADLKSMRGENSFTCYKDLYSMITLAIHNEERVFITIKDEVF